MTLYLIQVLLEGTGPFYLTKSRAIRWMETVTKNAAVFGWAGNMR